jgi:hypothetical protein
LSADGAPRLAAGRFIRKKTLEILDRPLQPFLELDHRLPAELLAGECDVGAALGRVVGGKRFEHDLRARPGEPDHLFGELENGELVRVAEVDRSGEGMRVVHHPEHAVDQVVHVA